MLDLSGPKAPEAGRGLAALELASRLARDAERLRSDADTESLDGLRAGARAALRSLAAELAQLGETLAGAGSAELLWAMTIDARLEALDTLIAECDDAALLAALSTDLDALQLDWSRGVSVGADALDRGIGSALAALALSRLDGARSGAGWFVSGQQTGVDGDEIRARLGSVLELGLSEEAGQRLGSLADELERAAGWPTYQRRAWYRKTVIVDALDAVLGLPSWVNEATRARLAEDLSGAITGWDEPALELVAAQGRVMDALDRMDPGRESDRLRARAMDAVSERSAEPEASLPATRLAADALGVSVSRVNLRDDDHLVRVAKPAWRALVPRVRGVTVNGRDEAVNLLVDPSGATDPGVLATIAAQRRLFEDFDAIERISGAIESGFGGASSLETAVGDRLLAIGQDMQASDDDSATLELVRRMDAELRTLAQIAEDAPPARRVMGDRGADLPLRISSLRDAWLRAWAVAGGNGPDAAVLEDLRLLSELTRLLADVEAFTRLEAINAWPGFELSPRARRALSDGLTPAIDELVPDAMRGGNAVARQRSLATIVTLRGDFAGALLAGRLSRLGAEAGLVTASALEELALGPAVDPRSGRDDDRGAWMASHRSELADISRYAEELGRMVTEGRADAQTQAPVRTLVSWRSLRLLETLEAERRSAPAE